jgi:hypothetical protein
MLQRVPIDVVSVGLFVVGWMLAGGVSPAQGQTKAPEWTHGLEFKARKADQTEFKDAKNYGCEAFLDKNNNNLVFLIETGSIGVVPAGNFNPPKEVKAPKWLYAMKLGVRKAGEAEFSKDTKKYGVEVFKDENSGTVVYISETGSIAVVRGINPAGGSDKKGPKHAYGYELRVRKGTEADFTPDTKKYGVEVFQDEDAGTLVYISETGAIAARPAGSAKLGTEVKKPNWMHGLNLKVRKAGEADFTDSTKKWGVEVFKDDRAGNLIYIAEGGDLSIVPAGSFNGVPETKAPKWLHAQEFQVRKGGEKEFTPSTKKVGVEVFRDENTGNTVYITETGSLVVLTPAK